MPGAADPTEVTAQEHDAFARVTLARHPGRPRTLQLTGLLFTDWTELHGDRLFADDRAVVGGPARLGDRWVMLVGQEKGTDAETRVIHNFGMPHPEGYRKAKRLMLMAQKFRLPLICLVDTPAAHAGVEAEERGQAWAIADSMLTMFSLSVPTISVILSEGGSGGALALAVADRVLALENAIYTVAPPETCAAILYRDANQKARAARSLRPEATTARDLGVVDELVPEPSPGAHAHPAVVAAALKGSLIRHLGELESLSSGQLLEKRERRYHNPAPGTLP